MAEKSLVPAALIFALYDGDPKRISSYRGEIRVDIIRVELDSDETAFVTPSHRVSMTEDVQLMLIEKLEPLGIRYMRWWVDGRLVGRTFGEATL